MEATRRAVPQLQPAPGVYFHQPGAAWIGNIGNTDFVTVKSA